jgi:hypothetical protein
MKNDPLRPYGNSFQVVEGDNDDGVPCKDCKITGKCFCLGEKGNRVINNKIKTVIKKKL